MNAKFTPGPWHLSKAFGQQGLIGPDIGYPVAAVTGYYMSVGQTEANARLIAAAPMLLEACELFAAYDSGDPDDFEQLVHGYAVAIEATRAAIAAATGETK